jgi:hypothetical protein
VVAFFTITDIPIIGMALHGFVPAFFVGNMTLYFAVRFRSGFAAGMVAAGLLVLILMFSELIAETRYFLYFNPYDVPIPAPGICGCGKTASGSWLWEVFCYLRLCAEWR